MDKIKWMDWLYPLVFIVGGVIVGLLFKQVALPRVKKMLVNMPHHGGEGILEAIRRFSISLFVTGGLYLALQYSPITLKIAPLLEKLLIALAIFIVTLALSKVAVAMVNIYAQNDNTALPSSSIFTNLTYLFVLCLGVLVILQSLGISITPILTALGVGGLAVALALQETLANMFAGLHILMSRQVRPGDFIRLESGEEGYVDDINWRNTTIRVLPNNMVIVPNAKLASAVITNFHQPEEEMSFLVELGVSYGSDLKHVEEVTIDVCRQVLKTVPGGVASFEPFIRYHTFSDFSINFSVILRVKEFVDQYLVKHEFVKVLHERYKKESIEIPFPVRTVHMAPGKLV